MRLSLSRTTRLIRPEGYYQDQIPEVSFLLNSTYEDFSFEDEGMHQSTCDCVWAEGGPQTPYMKRTEFHPIVPSPSSSSTVIYITCAIKVVQWPPLLPTIRQPARFLEAPMARKKVLNHQSTHLVLCCRWLKRRKVRPFEYTYYHWYSLMVLRETPHSITKYQYAIFDRIILISMKQDKSKKIHV